jgi:hypothetical protein
MWVLILLVPVQLAAGWWQKTLTLTHYLYFFSIYQHFQFVPVIFMAAFCVAMVYLWERHKVLLRCLTVVMGVYAIASASFPGDQAFTAALFCCFSREKCWGSRRPASTSFVAFGLGIVAAVLVIGMYYGIAKTNTSVADDNGQYVGKFDTWWRARCRSMSRTASATGRCFATGSPKAAAPWCSGMSSPFRAKSRPAPTTGTLISPTASGWCRCCRCWR